ncbi:hypothetical protein ISS03_05480 [Patescibacteria group bacterium]|nr:hypothetical protein [Patescibacteria group bacterium]
MKTNVLGIAVLVGSLLITTTGNGEESKDEAQDLFLHLRKSMALLEPGQKSVEVGLSYIKDEKDRSPLLTSLREVGMSVTLRLGLTKRLGASVKFPVAWKQVHVKNLANGTGLKEDSFGAGDVSLSLSYSFWRQKGWKPEVVGTSAPPHL